MKKSLFCALTGGTTMKKAFFLLILLVLCGLCLTLTSCHEHEFGPWKKTEATCYTAGYEERKCMVEGCTYTERRNEIEALGHDISEWTVNVVPTCTEDGEEKRWCSRCGERETRAVPATGHEFGEWNELNAPACGKSGYSERKCSVCGEREIQTLDALEHQFSEWEEHGLTCTTNGEKVRECALCGKRETEDLFAIGHQFGEWVQTKAPEEQANGEEARECSACGKRETRILPALASLGLEFTSNGDGTCYVSGIGTCTDNNIIVPNYSPKKELVVGIGADAFNSQNMAIPLHFESIDIPERVTYIGKNAFCGCYLKFITFRGNSQLERLEEGAFLYCHALNNIHIPDRVTVIEPFAFSGCSGIVKVTFGVNSQLKVIGEEAFANCVALGHYEPFIIPDSVTDIGRRAFCGGASGDDIKNTIQFGNNSQLTNMDYAFEFCNQLANFVVPDSWTAIGEGMFLNCGKLESVTFGANTQVTTIGESAFNGCGKLKSVCIPAGVTEIGRSTFSGAGLTELSFEENSKLKRIEEGAFSNNKMTSILLPEGITYIGRDAFSYCTKLTNICIPETVTEIGNGAFTACERLTSITLPNSLTTIGARAFQFCEKLTNIHIPDSVTLLGSEAFRKCTNLTSVTFGENSRLEELYSKLFADCPKMTDFTIPESVKIINGTFANSNFKHIVIPSGVTTITSGSFQDCAMLESVTFEGNSQLTELGPYAFYNCSKLKSIHIPDGVTKLGDRAFSGCEALESVTFGENSQLTEIGFWVFEQCVSLKNIILPSGLENIVSNAFVKSGIESIVFLSNVNVIYAMLSGGAYEPTQCNSLKSITLPATANKYGMEAFFRNPVLTDIYFCGTEKQWKQISDIWPRDVISKLTIHYNCQS